MVLVCDFCVGRGGDGNHHHCNRAAARIVGLAFLLEVRCACHDRRGAGLRLSGAAQSRKHWLCAVSRSTAHDGSQNGRRIHVAARNYFFGIYRPERSGGGLCRGIFGKESIGQNRISQSHHQQGGTRRELRVQQIQFYPTTISRRRAHFRFCGCCVRRSIDPAELPWKLRPTRLPESRRKVVSEL